VIGGEPLSVYKRLREKFGGYRRVSRETSDRGSLPFTDHRDPGSMADALGVLEETMGWGMSLAQADLMAQWADIVGDDVAAHAIPTGAQEGVLEVACDSSAWATQLRLMKATLLESLLQRFPQAGLMNISVKGPGAPSWKHGPRSVPGRGPRDTYG
jgi:predicted nucleic acid-binding Zn ribbon protein